MNASEEKRKSAMGVVHFSYAFNVDFGLKALAELATQTWRGVDVR